MQLFYRNIWGHYLLYLFQYTLRSNVPVISFAIILSCFNYTCICFSSQFLHFVIYPFVSLQFYSNFSFPILNCSLPCVSPQPFDIRIDVIFNTNTFLSSLTPSLILSINVIIKIKGFEPFQKYTCTFIKFLNYFIQFRKDIQHLPMDNIRCFTRLILIVHIMILMKHN